jgi:pectin methylesterase-like acyl-CoA thioesterase
MKKITLLLLAVALVAPQILRAQTVIFTDTFSSSTTNGTSTPGGTPTASSTSYDLASTKDGRTCSIGAGKFTVKLAGGTTAGYIEAQAIFASTPVQLVNIGDSITLTVAFTNSVGTLLAGGSGSLICAGLYYSGSPSALPVAGSLVNTGLGSGVTFTNGFCQNWQGYVSQLASNTLTSKVYTRTNQGALNNANQDLLFSGSGTGLYNTPGGAQLGANFTGGPTLVSGAKYTLSFTILLTAVGQVAVTNSLFDVNGSLICTYGGTSSGGATFINNGNYFDGLAIGVANKGTSFNPSIDISQIQITKNVYAAPVITGLTNRTVVAGTSPILAPTVTANPSAAYQWQTNGVNIGGATSSALTLNNVQYAQDGWIYSLIATNVMGSVTNSMTLSVIVTPSITGLNNQSANVGDNVSISPTVGGVPAPSYQWRFNGVNLVDGLDGNGSTISGSTTASLGIANAQVADGGTYSLVASNSAGMVTNSMSLTVAAGNQAPVITGPANITVIQGNNGTFSASATGVPVPTLQWLDQTGTPIVSATNSTLVLTNVQYSQNGYIYSVVASNIAGVVTNGATLTVYVPPAISVQPVSLVVTSTQSSTFSVTASGVPAVAYQWYFGTNAIGGATSSSYNIPSAAAANIGNFFVVITNVAGSVTSSIASLLVNSTMSGLTFSPNNGATGVCYDTLLAITFDSAPSLGAAGTIKIYNVTNSATPVDTINVALGAVQQRTFPGDGQAFAYQTIQISGNTAKISPHFGAMSSNASYYVTIDNGAFTDVTGAYFVGITATNVWKIATKVGGPLDATNPVVNADGSADFVTVQGAINSLAVGTNATQRVVSIRNGLYNEIVDIAGKHNVTLRGQSRSGAVIYFPNNNNFQAPVNGGTTHARMTFKVNANDIVLDTLTVSNSTPQGGSQAEALMIESSAKRCIVYNSELDSRQDTILANVNSSQAYFYKSTVKGNFDYIWGGGNLFFDQCEIRTIPGASGFNLTAARTDTLATNTPTTNFPWLNPGGTYSANGMSFVNCTFTADSGVGSVTLAGGNGTAGNNVSWYGCDFATNYIAPSASLFSGNFVFWQDLNTMTNSPVTFAVVTSISGSDPRLLAATNIPTWLYGWSPALAPNIITNPISQTVNYASPATFSVLATGIPNPTYQWQHAGTNLPSATSSSLTIASTTLNDGGTYAVIVTTPAGNATSSTVTLTVNPPPNSAPVFTAPISGTNITINVGVNLSVACTATDSDTPSQTLIYSLLTGPSGATINTNSGVLTWRPTVASTNTTNPVKVSVTDNGIPNLSATNSFTISVNALTQPTVDSSAYAAGQFSATINGQIGPDYALQATTNLDGGTWTTVATTNSPASMPVILTDPNAGSQPVQFYRTVTGPPLP